MELDPTDHKMIKLLQHDGRISNAKLADAVGLSQSACLRRLRLLERSGVIKGYVALVDQAHQAKPATFIVEIVLDRQTDEFMDRFEAAVKKCPDVQECYLMTGSADYVLRVQADDQVDFEQIHRDQLARLPGVSRLHSSFAIRRVVGKSQG